MPSQELAFSETYMITSSLNSYPSVELTLLLSQDLDSELAKPRLENWLLKSIARGEKCSNFAFLSGGEKALPTCGRISLWVCLAAGWTCAVFVGAAGCGVS